MKYEYFIGLRYLRAKRRQTFVSVITAIAVSGVMVGVAALIIVLSGMVGVQDYMRDKILGFNAHVLVRKFGGMTDPWLVVDQLKDIKGVTGASPFIEDQAVLKGRRSSTGVLVRGIDPATVSSVMSIGEAIEQGSLSALDPVDGSTDLPTIAIGGELASELGLYLGSEVSLIIPEEKVTPLGLAPSVKRFRVGAIFQFGFYQVDSAVVLMNLGLADRLFGRGGNVDAIEVKTTNIYKVDEIRERIQDRLGGTYLTESWYQRQRQLFAALKMEQYLSGLVLSLIMLVASFNIVSMLLMLVMEKYRDIAILKSMGASDFGIMKIFITQGTIIGLIGTFTGVVVGILVCWLQMRYEILSFDPSVYQFSVVPMKLTWENLAGVSAGAILLSFLTTLYPSWQAARTKPAESLRYE